VKSLWKGLGPKSIDIVCRVWCHREQFLCFLINGQLQHFSLFCNVVWLKQLKCRSEILISVEYMLGVGMEVEFSVLHFNQVWRCINSSFVDIKIFKYKCLVCHFSVKPVNISPLSLTNCKIFFAVINVNLLCLG